MKVVGYIRVARNNEGEVNSLENQKQNLINYCNKHNYELVNIYADEGLSGTSTKTRKALNQLINDSEGNDFEMIIIKNISSLTRNTKDLINLIRTFKENNKKVYFLNEEMKAKEFSDLNIVILNAIAQEESKNIRERLKNRKSKENRVVGDKGESSRVL